MICEENSEDKYQNFKCSHFESIQNIQKNNQFRKRTMMILKAFESKQKLIMNNIIILKMHFASFEKLTEFSKNYIFKSRTSELRAASELSTLSLAEGLVE